jgi:hypothetical protein
MNTDEFLNYELYFFGHSLITCNDKGIIVDVSAIPFQKYIGIKIDELDKILTKRGKEKGSKEYKGMKFLGRTKKTKLIIDSAQQKR